MLPISVVVPCFPRDTHKLKKCLDSMERQTVKPSEVIIGHSEISLDACDNLKDSLGVYSFVVLFAPTTKQCFAAENRNRACSYARCEYISFFDADDIMVPQRLELIWKIINLHNPHCVLHGYSGKQAICDHIIDIDHVKCVFGEELHDIAARTKRRHLHINGAIHHGHSTVRRDVIERVKFNESDQYRIGEDSLFVREILEKYPRDKNTMIFIDTPLSYYVPALQQKH